MAEDKTWLEDFIISFLKSPPWRVPLDSFIDEHCIVFDNEEENKFEYTKLHQDYQKIVEGLLEEYLEELGVTAEEFVEVVEGAGTRNEEVGQMIQGEILATDDFMVFKKMMTARNTELECSALKAMQEEAVQAKQAIEAKRIKETGLDEEMSPEEREALEEALRASVADSELVAAELEREQAQLEAAIQMSLAAEAERLERIKQAEESERAAAAEAAASEEAAKNAEGEAKARAEATAQKARALESKAKFEKERLIQQEIAFLEQQKIQGAPDPESKAECEELVFESTPPPGSAPAAGGFLGDLPSLDILQKQNQENMRKVKEEAARNRKARKEKKKKKKKALMEKARITEEELARRDTAVVERRKKIVLAQNEAKKNELATYKETVFQPAVEKAEAAAPRPKDNSAAAPKALSPEEQAEQEKRNAFRHILANNFKQVEQKRQEKARQQELNIASQYARLSKLREAISLDEEEEYLKQEQERRAQLAAFHKNIKSGGVISNID